MAHLVSFGLDSILNQTILQKYPSSIEVIAVDDCSTDTSLEVLRRYEKAHPQLFHVIHSPCNRKQGGARNLGLAAARGEWIGFMDADDWIAPDFCEKMLAKADATGADMVGCWAARADEHSFEITQIRKFDEECHSGIMGDTQYKHLVVYSYGVVWNKIYKAKNILCDNYGKVKYDIFPENIFYEDEPFTIKCLFKSKNYQIVQEYLYYYYKNIESTTQSKFTIKSLDDLFVSGKTLLDEAKEYGYYEKFKDEIEMRYIAISYISPLQRTLFNSNFNHKKSKLLKIREHILASLPDFQKNPYYNTYLSREQRIYVRLHLISIPLLLLCCRPVQMACRLRRLCIWLVRDPALAFAKIRACFR